MRIAYCTFIIGILVFACKNEPSETGPTAESLHNEAITLADEGRYEEAVQKITKALDKDPSNLRYLNDRAALHFEVGHLEKSLADYNYMLQLDSQCTAGMYGKALILYDRGELESALAYFYDIVRIQGNLNKDGLKSRKLPLVDAPFDEVFRLIDSLELYLDVEPVAYEELIPYKETYYDIKKVD